MPAPTPAPVPAPVPALSACLSVLSGVQAPFALLLLLLMLLLLYCCRPWRCAGDPTCQSRQGSCAVIRRVVGGPSTCLDQVGVTNIALMCYMMLHCTAQRESHKDCLSLLDSPPLSPPF